jgi:anti-sigma B factor antagonist
MVVRRSIMAIHVRFEGEVAVLSGIARLMNDPRHFDAGRDVGELLDQGYLRFVLELGNVRETGPTVLGLLTTLTRKIRQADGEAVLANLSPPMEKFLDEMRMDSYWDVFDDVEEAIAFLEKRRMGTMTFE